MHLGILALTDITVPPHIRESLKRTKDDSESLPPATKKARLVTAVRRKGKTKVMVVRVPSSLIKKNTGGKGRQRFRMKMALEGGLYQEPITQREGALN